MYIRGRGEEGNNSLYKEEEEREKEMKGCYPIDTFCCYNSYDNPKCPHEKCKCPSPTNGGIGCPPLNYYPPCEEHNSPPPPPSPPNDFSNPSPSPPPSVDNNPTYSPPLPPLPPTVLRQNHQGANSAYSFIPNLLVMMIATMVVLFTLILALVYYYTIGVGSYTYTSSFDDRNNRAQLRRRRARQSLQTSGSIRRSIFYAWPPSGFHARPRGLDESLICLIPIYTYEGSEESPIGSSTECVVCLGAFLPGDKLRLLPKCTHSFHVECIDEWLRSRTTCPLCRANVVNFNYANTAMAASASAQPSLNPNEPIPTSSSTCHQSLSTSTPHAPQSLPESTHPHKPVTELKRSFSDGLLPTKNASMARSAMSFNTASSASFAGTEFAKGKEVIKHGPNDPPIAKNNMLSSIKRTLSDSRIFSFKRKNEAAAPTTSSHSHERPPI